MTTARAPTGLIKVCPRCGLRGDVFMINGGVDPPMFEVEWERTIGPGGVLLSRRDTCIVLGDILSPSFGCGYDFDDTWPRRACKEVGCA